MVVQYIPTHSLIEWRHAAHAGTTPATEHQMFDTKGASFGFIQQSSQKQGSPKSNNREELKQKVAAPSAYLAKVEWLHSAGSPSLSPVPCGSDTASR